MKIAFLSYYTGKVERGVESIVEELAKKLVISNEVYIIQGSNTDSNSKIKRISVPVKSHNISSNSISRRLLLDTNSLEIKKFTQKAIPVLLDIQPDIVVPWNNGWQTLLTRIHKVGKLVSVGESGIGWDDRLNLYMFPDIFIGLTEYQCNWAKKINPLVKVAKIPNGVDITRFNPRGKKINFGLPHPIILTVGALETIKRHTLIIDAVSALGKGSLIIIGDGALKGELEDYANNKLPGRFKIIKMKYSEIDSVYRSADIFTYATSPWESFGVVLLESMASNLPTVTSNDPIRKEIIGNGGVCANVENPEIYKNALQYALNCNWSNKPRAIAEKYSWDKIANRYEDIFLSLLK